MLNFVNQPWAIIGGVVGIWVVWFVAFLAMNRRAARRLRARLGPAWRRVSEEYGLQEETSGRLFVALQWRGVVAGRNVQVGTYQRVMSKFVSSWSPKASLVVAIDRGTCRLAPVRPRMPGATFASEGDRSPPGLNHVGWQVMRVAEQIPGRTAELLLEGVRFDGSPPPLDPEMKRILTRWVGTGRAFLLEESLCLVFRVTPGSFDTAESFEAVLRDATLIADWAEGTSSP